MKCIYLKNALLNAVIHICSVRISRKHFANFTLSTKNLAQHQSRKLFSLALNCVLIFTLIGFVLMKRNSGLLNKLSYSLFMVEQSTI